MARMHEASAQAGPIAALARRSLRGGGGDGIHLGPPVTAPRHEEPGEGFPGKTSARAFCLQPGFRRLPLLRCRFTASSLTKPQVYSPALCVCPLGCRTNVSAAANTLEFE